MVAFLEMFHPNLKSFWRLLTLVLIGLDLHFLWMKMFSLCLPDDSLRVCVQAGPGCCTSKMEDSYMAAVRSETQQKMRSYSFELKYLIAGHSKAYQGEAGRWRATIFMSLIHYTVLLLPQLFENEI